VSPGSTACTARFACIRRATAQRRQPGFACQTFAAFPNASPPPGQGLCVASPSPGDKWRTLLPEEAALWHRVRKLPARHGRSRQRVCRRCILQRGIMCIFMRRAASILDSNMPAYRFLYENDASQESVLQKRCNFRVPMPTRRLGGCSDLRCTMCCGLFDGA
jgi:hypothetical protein